MQTFKELCNGKMHVAVQAMIDGLKTHSKREDFIIKMSTYGELSEKNICFGCAATCAVQQLSGVTFTADKIRSKFPAVKGYSIDLLPSSQAVLLDMKSSDINHFEESINALRQTGIGPLMTYFGFDDIVKEISIYSFLRENPLEKLATSNWEKNLEGYQKLADFLKENDL
jgi:hypothetical protein